MQLWEGEPAPEPDMEGDLYEIDYGKGQYGNPKLEPGSVLILRYYSKAENGSLDSSEADASQNPGSGSGAESQENQGNSRPSNQSSLVGKDCQPIEYGTLRSDGFFVALEKCKGATYSVYLECDEFQGVVNSDSWSKTFPYRPGCPIPRNYSMQVTRPNNHGGFGYASDTDLTKHEYSCEAGVGGEATSPSPTAAPTPTPTPTPTPSAPTYAYQPLNAEVVAPDGMTVRVAELLLTPKSGSTQLSVVYPMTNNTADKKVTEGSFALFFEDGTKLNQFGFFNDLFPVDTNTRRYTFEWTGGKKALLIEYEADFFASKPTQAGLKWKAPQ